MIKSSGSVGANYIEANESRYWLKLIDIEGENEQEKARKELEKESTELMNIFGSILRKSE